MSNKLLILGIVGGAIVLVLALAAGLIVAGWLIFLASEPRTFFILEADVADCASVEQSAMSDTAGILEHRLEALGFSRVKVQQPGACQIRVELPARVGPAAVAEALTTTGLLEFVPMGNTPETPGTVIVTDCAQPAQIDCGPADTAPASGKVYHTLMTGAGLDSASAGRTETNDWVVNFTLSDAGSQIFSDYTTSHISEYLAIVIDKEVISVPRIQAVISKEGVISGRFTQESARQLAAQLRYGALPVPLKVIESGTK
jgi:preprotein translocase subunit SecD